MADGPRITNSLDPHSLVPDERAVVGGALRAQGRQNKNSPHKQPAGQGAAGHLPTKPWYQGWLAVAAAVVTVVAVIAGVAVATSGKGHRVSTAAVAPTTPPATTATVPTSAAVALATATAQAAVPSAPVPLVPSVTASTTVASTTSRWRIVAIVRSLGPVPKQDSPYDVIDDQFTTLHAGQKMQQTVTCTPYFCSPPKHTFVPGEQLAYWGLVAAADGLRANPLPFSHTCQGRTFQLQPGYAVTLRRVSATLYQSTLSRPARTLPENCGSVLPSSLRSSSFVVDRTITKLP